MVRTVLLLLPALLCACTLPQKRAGFQSVDPSERTLAIAQAARDKDPATVPELIEELDSADPAVRMMAIGALRRITGETMGYDHAAPRAERNLAIERWIAWHADQQPAAAQADP